MKNKKSFVSLLLAVTFTAQMFVVPAFANTEEVTIVKNEFEMLQELDAEDENANYVQELKDEFFELKDKSEDELEILGYDEEQIEVIQNFDGSDEMLARAAATITIDLAIKEYEYDSGNDTSTARIKIGYEWDRRPAERNKDIFGLAWGNDFELLSSSYIKVYYSNENYAGASKSVKYWFKDTGLNAGKAVFPLYQEVAYSSSVPIVGVTGLSGSGYVYLEKAERVNVLKVYANYGHSTSLATPDLEVGTGGVGLGFSFSKNVVEPCDGVTDSKRITEV